MIGKHLYYFHISSNRNAKRKLTQRQRCIALAQILAGNPDQRKLQLLAQIDCVIAILQLLHESAQRRKTLVHLLPIDDARLDDVEQLENGQAIGQIRVQPVDVRRHAHRVHPVAVCYTINMEYAILSIYIFVNL